MMSQKQKYFVILSKILKKPIFNNYFSLKFYHKMVLFRVYFIITIEYDMVLINTISWKEKQINETILITLSVLTIGTTTGNLINTPNTNITIWL